MDRDNSEDKSSFGQPSVGEVYDIEGLAAQMYNEVFEGLTEYCNIPPKYSHCVLGTSEGNVSKFTLEDVRKIKEGRDGCIYNPQEKHLRTIAFFKLLLSGEEAFCFDGDILRPRKGAYLFGPPGTGKTHLMSAYANDLKRILNGKLGNLSSYLEREMTGLYERYVKNIGAPEAVEDSEGGVSVRSFDLDSLLGLPSDDSEMLKRELEELRLAVKTRYKYKPIDIVYIGFGPLYELCITPARERTLNALMRAPVCFVDDVDPKRDPKKADVISYVIERRYDAGNNATFISANRNPEDMGNTIGDDVIAERLHSRFQEMFYPLSFEGCSDWRVFEGRLENEWIDQMVTERLQRDNSQEKS